MTGLLRKVARTAAVAGGLTLTATLLPAAVVTAPASAASVQSQLAAVRNATAAYHSLDAAEADGFVPLLKCFDDPALGGMGQHYFIPSRLDGSVNLTKPPVLVYEVDGSRLQLVAVEYVVPGPPDMTPPVLLDRNFTYNASLGVWKLHAWIWRPNHAGMFEDFNAAVSMCPAGSK